MSGQQRSRRYSAAWRTGTTVFFPSLIKAMMKRDWHGYQHFPRQGGMLVAGNHLSYVDWAAMALFVAASAARGATTIAASQMLGAVAMLALYGALDQVMGLRPMRKGAAL